MIRLKRQEIYIKLLLEFINSLASPYEKDRRFCIFLSFDRLKEFTLNLFRFCKLDFVKSSWKRLGILKKRCFHFWSRTDKDRSSNEDIIFPALLFLIGASTVLWEEALQEKDPSNQLKLISLIYGLQIVSFLLLRPVLRSILKVEQSLSIQKYILFAVFVSITFLITFEEHWTLAFYGGILTFAVASFLSAETSYVIFKQKLAFRLYYISIIPLSMGFIFFGNVISNLFLNVNLNYLSYLVYGIVLIFLYRINSKTSVASILPNQPAPTDAVKQGSQLLKEIDISNVEEKLNSFIEAKQYRDSNFRLSDLSLHLGISLHQTSCYLNQHKGISFNDFINHFRIEEAKRIILKSNHNINLNDIALASGFNSYTSFHRSFKKITGISPSRFGKASGGAP